MSTIINRILALARIGVGIPSVLAPLTSASLCYFSIQPSAAIIFRMAGGRDLALGALLWSTQNSDATTQRRVLLAGIAVDAIDVLSAAACVYQGNLELLPAGIVGGGALGLIGLASWRLKHLGTATGSGVKL